MTRVTFYANEIYRSTVYRAHDLMQPRVSGGTMTQVVQTSARINTTSSQGTAAQYLDFGKYFEKGGLYKCRIVYGKGTDSGIMKFSKNADATYVTFDTYNASATWNNVYEFFMEIQRGFNGFTIDSNTKNGSSTNFRAVLQFIQFDLIQEYPTINDDGYMQNPQGAGEFLLYSFVDNTNGAQNLENIVLAGINSVSGNNRINPNNYDEIIIRIKGLVFGSLELQAIVDGLSTISQMGYTAIGASLSAVNLSGRSSIQVASTSVLTGADNFEAEIRIVISQQVSGYAGTARCTSFNASAVMVGKEETSWVGSGGAIGPITIQVSTSQWQVPTQFTVWGKKLR